MRRQINLLLSFPKKQKDLVNADLIVRLSLIIIVMLIMFSLYTSWENKKQKAPLASIKKEISLLRDQENELKEKLDKLLSETTLSIEVEKLKAELEELQFTFDKLNVSPENPRLHFSIFFDDLGRYTPQGLWFSGISISNGGRNINLSGSAVQAELVPQFIQQLRNSKSLNERKFQEFTIEKNGTVSFQLRSSG